MVGCLLDMDRGSINFFKDGKDLGQAFKSESLKSGILFPFIQVQEECSISIFHPSVYPSFRDPVVEAKNQAKRIQEPEPQPRKSSSSRQSKPSKPDRISVRQSYKKQRKSLTKKQQKLIQKQRESEQHNELDDSPPSNFNVNSQFID